MNETAEINKIEYYKKTGSAWNKLLPTLAYTYYEDGNIETIKQDNVLMVEYYYDDFNQLIREDNKYLNNGNGYTITYSYDSVWKDMMTSIDGESITRDAIGNPTNYPNVAATLIWSQGNKLSSLYYPEASSWIQISFLYNENGLRTQQNMYASNTNYIKYFWLNNILQSEYSSLGYEIVYCYDANGSLIGFTYETGTTRTFYRYAMNLQGDVIALLDENYNVVVKYTYDTWGQVLCVTDSSGTLITDTTHIGHRNPIRYRGYYYDIETGLYYLQSRYYDPEVGRFISADSYISTGQGVLGHNMFAYCGNNPVMGYDPFGHFSWGDFLDIGTTIISGVYSFAVGLGTFSSSLATTGRPGLSIVKGVAKGATTYEAINNAVNAVYYNYFSEPNNDLDQDVGKSSYVDGYVNRWERLDYAKYMTGADKYNKDAWLYYSEYSLHMWGWYFTGWSSGKDIPIISGWAESFRHAGITPGKNDDRPKVYIPVIIWGCLGV